MRINPSFDFDPTQNARSSPHPDPEEIQVPSREIPLVERVNSLRKNISEINRNLSNDLVPINTITAFQNVFAFMTQEVSPMLETYSGERNEEGLPHGKGKMKYQNKEGEVIFEFEGRFNKGKRTGFGTHLFEGGFYWASNYQHDQLYTGDEAKIPILGAVFTGHLSCKGNFTGPIEIAYPDNDPRKFYRGRVNKELQPYAIGTLTYRNGGVYTGLFHDGCHPIEPNLTQSENERQEPRRVSEQPTRKRKRDSEDLKEHLLEKEPPPTLGYSKQARPSLAQRFTLGDGRVYEGRLMNCLFDGFGRIHNPDGTVFEGCFEKGMAEGLVRILFPNGEGWRHVRVIGGVIIEGGLAKLDRNGYRYLGLMNPHGKFVGPITIFYPPGSLIKRYDGMVNENLGPSGAGKMKFRSGTCFEGEFANGKLIWPDATHEGQVITPLSEKAEDLGQYSSQSRFNHTAGLIAPLAHQNRALSSKDEESVENVFSDSVSSSNPNDMAAEKNPNWNFLNPKTPSSDFFEPFTPFSNDNNSSSFDFYPIQSASSSPHPGFEEIQIPSMENPLVEQVNINRNVYNDPVPINTITAFQNVFAFMTQEVSPMLETYSGERNEEGLPHGKGKMKYQNKEGKVIFEFEGRFNEGKRTGFGTHLFEGGFYWASNYQHDQLYTGDEAKIPILGAVFTGHLSCKGNFTGPIEIAYPDNDPRKFYRGRINKELQPYGIGTLTYRNGNVYTGLFHDGCHPIEPNLIQPETKQ